MLIERVFKLSENKTTVRTEIVSGITTFMTLSFILFVQPTVLSKTGMDFGAVMAATCIASAFATFLMRIYANYPIALAPAMGHNFYFAFTVCGAVTAGGMGTDGRPPSGPSLYRGSYLLCLPISVFVRRS